MSHENVIRKIQISQPVTGDDEWQAVKEPIMSGWLTAGPKVREFEDLFSEIHGVRHSVAVTSATTALHLALVALGVGPGDEVIVPSFTWVATANVALYCGATPVFADIRLDTFNIDPEEVRKKITPRTKAIIPVHLFGLCADIDEIRRVAPGIPIVEDGACAAGSVYKGKYAGTLGEIGCFSFHPRKSVTTGEGGICTTNDDKLAELMRNLRNHGASISEEERHHGARPYLLPEFNLLGYNYRMTDLQGAMGVVQLKKLKRFISEREKWATFLSHELSSIPWLKVPQIPSGYGHGWQSYVTFVDESLSPMKRNDLMEKLLQAGISTRPGTHAIHMLGYYRERFGLQPQDYPNSMLANNQSLSLPLHNRMTEEDYRHIVSTLKSFS